MSDYVSNPLENKNVPIYITRNDLLHQKAYGGVRYVNFKFDYSNHLTNEKKICIILDNNIKIMI